jgi:hypothetical protein
MSDNLAREWSEALKELPTDLQDNERVAPILFGRPTQAFDFDEM